MLWLETNTFDQKSSIFGCWVVKGLSIMTFDLQVSKLLKIELWCNMPPGGAQHVFGSGFIIIHKSLLAEAFSGTFWTKQTSFLHTSSFKYR